MSLSRDILELPYSNRTDTATLDLAFGAVPKTVFVRPLRDIAELGSLRISPYGALAYWGRLI